MPTTTYKQVPAYKYERIIASIVAVWVIVLVSYLILSNSPFDETRVYFVKILLALSIAIIVGTLPGFIEVSYHAAGLALRAMGGAAAFVFVYLVAPSVPGLKLGPPEIRINELRSLDFRPYVQEPSASNISTSQLAITVPIGIRNDAQPSQTGSLQKTVVELPIGGKRYKFDWYYFVEHLPDPGGTFLSSKPMQLATSQDLPPGVQIYKEVMHLSSKAPNWEEFLDDFVNTSDEYEVVDVTLDTTSGESKLQCKFTPGLYKTMIEQYEADNSIAPYVSVECE
jgi:hypothetical protein